MSSDQPTGSSISAHPVAPPRVDRRAQHEQQSKPKDTRSDGQLRRDIERTRDELAQTLDALEHKLDVPARSRELLDTGKRQLSKQWDDNPLLMAGVAVGAAVALVGAIAGGVWLTRR